MNGNKLSNNWLTGIAVYNALLFLHCLILRDSDATTIAFVSTTVLSFIGTLITVLVGWRTFLTLVNQFDNESLNGISIPIFIVITGFTVMCVLLPIFTFVGLMDVLGSH